MMTLRRIILVVIFIIAVATAGWLGRITATPDTHSSSVAEVETQQWTCGMHPQVIRDAPGLCPICAMDLTPVRQTATASAEQDLDATVQYWVAPMDPSYVRDQPGLSPMGMELVPVYAGQSAFGSVIEIDPITRQNMGIRTEEAKRGALIHSVRTVGRIEQDETRQYSVNSKVTGWVETLHVNTTGQSVRAGQPLLDIYSPQLVTAQQELLLAIDYQQRVASSTHDEIRQGAEQLVAAARLRLQRWDISAAQISALEQQGTLRKTMTLYAPASGVVTRNLATSGMAVTAGQELFQIADFNHVWVVAELYEQDLPWIEVGQPATVTIATSATEYQGRVDYLYPYIDPQTQTVQARIVLANDDGQLKPKMFADVIIDSTPIDDAVLIPAEAILDSGEQQWVFIAHDKGQFEPRLVQIGPSDDQGQVMIRQGILAGERVVVSAQFLLDSETQLRSALRKMTSVSDEPTTEPASDDLEQLF